MLYRCIGVTGEIVFKFSRTGCLAKQNFAYSGCKRKHLMKLQMITASSDLILHADAPNEGCRNDCAL